jgi:hypothetical protein
MSALAEVGMLVILGLLVVLVAVGLSGGLSGAARPGGAALESGARWETHTEMGGGVTTVAVRRVAPARSGPVELGRQVISTIPDDAADWETRYHAAMAEARSRVAALESESD